MHRPLLAIAVLTLLACDQKKDPDKSSASTTASSAGSASVAPAVVKLSLDATLVDHVKAHAEGCTVSVEAGQAYACKAGITDAMGKYVRDKKPEAFASTMPVDPSRGKTCSRASGGVPVKASKMWVAMADGARWTTGNEILQPCAGPAMS